MICGLVVVALLGAREAIRLSRPGSRAVGIVDRLLVPMSVALVAVLAVRVVQLVAAGA